jgi:hypothetical protein
MENGGHTMNASNPKHPRHHDWAASRPAATGAEAPPWEQAEAFEKRVFDAEAEEADEGDDGHDDDPATNTCPECGGTADLMGAFSGGLVYRCRECGEDRWGGRSC